MGIKLGPTGNETVASVVDALILAPILPASGEEYVANASPDNFVSPVGMVARPVGPFLKRVKSWARSGIGKLREHIPPLLPPKGGRSVLGRVPPTRPGIAGIAEIRGHTKVLRDPEHVDKVKAKMLNGKFDLRASESIVSGYEDATGVIYLMEGQHKMKRGS